MGTGTVVGGLGELGGPPWGGLDGGWGEEAEDDGCTGADGGGDTGVTGGEMRTMGQYGFTDQLIFILAVRLPWLDSGFWRFILQGKGSLTCPLGTSLKYY